MQCVVTPTTRSPKPKKKRISVRFGARGMILSGSPLSETSRPRASVKVLQSAALASPSIMAIVMAKMEIMRRTMFKKEF